MSLSLTGVVYCLPIARLHPGPRGVPARCRVVLVVRPIVVTSLLLVLSLVVTETQEVTLCGSINIIMGTNSSEIPPVFMKTYILVLSWSHIDKKKKLNSLGLLSEILWVTKKYYTTKAEL